MGNRDIGRNKNKKKPKKDAAKPEALRTVNTSPPVEVARRRKPKDLEE